MDSSPVSPRPLPRARQGGVALVLVLWAGALISVIAAAFAFSVRTEVRLATAAVERAQAGALANAGVDRAVLGLLERNAAGRWQGDGRVYEFALASGVVRVVARAETGRIDINYAPRDLLVGLVESAIRTGIGTASGVEDGREESASPEAAPDAAHVADAIMDWRDGNDRRRLHGAEDADYRQADLPRGAGDRRFLSVSELAQVLGVTPELYAAIAPLATVYGTGPRVDAAYADRGVLAAIPGLDLAAVDDFIIERDVILADAVAADTDLRVAQRQIQGLARKLGSRAPKYLVAGRAAVYTVFSQGRLPSGAVAVRRAVVRLSRARGRAYRVYSWSETASFPDTGAADPDPEPRGEIVGALPGTS